MLVENIYIGRDNINTLEFRVNGVLKPLNPISKVDLVIPNLDITISDSNDREYPLKWFFTPSQTGIFEMKIGYVLSNSPYVEKTVNGIHVAKLYIYESSSANGLFWAELQLDIDL